MINFSVKIDGVPVELDQITDTLSHTIIQRTMAGYQQKLSGVSCPEHATEPEFRVDYNEVSGKANLVLVNTCCQKLTQACAERLSEN